MLGAGSSLRAADGPAVTLPAFSEANVDEFWAAVRDAFPLTREIAYFNTGGLGPVCERALTSYESTSRRLQERSETGHELFARARAVAARFFDVDAAELAFVRNATEGNSIVAAGLDLREGDEVILESHAHPGGSFPWLNQEKLRGVCVKVFEPDAFSAAGNLARIESLVTTRTRVVQVSHVTAPTGIVMPVGAIAQFCRERDFWFHVDGAQSAGMFPFSLQGLGCDSFATSGHKWLGGPHESGVLFIRRDRLDAVRPLHVGAYSADEFELPGRLTYVNSAQRHEYGTRNAATVTALAAAMEWQEKIGRDRIAARGRTLAARVRAGLARVPDVEILTPSPPELSASIVTFRSERVPFETLFAKLWREHRLRCRPVSEQGLDAVRVSTHLCNTPAECDRLVEAVTAILRAS